MRIEVAKGGFVALVDRMESPVDLKVVNSARISMGKKIDKMRSKDEKLISYLAKNEHTSPFRHSYMTFHVCAPIFVLRQWMKHQIGCAWNEISGRYVAFEDEYWRPMSWREQSESVKQGSGGDIGGELGDLVDQMWEHTHDVAFNTYRAMLEIGVCKEQARACLPLSIYSQCYWTVSVQALAHFLKLRLDSHAQVEIQDYAQAVKRLFLDNLEGGEVVMEALNG